MSEAYKFEPIFFERSKSFGGTKPRLGLVESEPEIKKSEKKINLTIYEDNVKDAFRFYNQTRKDLAILKTGTRPAEDVKRISISLVDRYRKIGYSVDSIKNTRKPSLERNLKEVDDWFEDFGEIAPEKDKIRMELLRGKSSLVLEEMELKVKEFELLKDFFEQDN